MCPYPWYQVMRLSKDKKQQRYQMVMYAKEHGVKPGARRYATGPKTVRKWLLRFIEGGYQALDDLPKKPHFSPGAISDDRVKKIVALKSVYKRLGAEQVKILETLPESAKTI
jgi:transposase-like protein